MRLRTTIQYWTVKAVSLLRNNLGTQFPKVAVNNKYAAVLSYCLLENHICCACPDGSNRYEVTASYIHTYLIYSFAYCYNVRIPNDT